VQRARKIRPGEEASAAAAEAARALRGHAPLAWGRRLRAGIWRRSHAPKASHGARRARVPTESLARGRTAYGNAARAKGVARCPRSPCPHGIVGTGLNRLWQRRTRQRRRTAPDEPGGLAPAERGGPPDAPVGGWRGGPPGAPAELAPPSANSDGGRACSSVRRAEKDRGEIPRRRLGNCLGHSRRSGHGHRETHGEGMNACIFLDSCLRHVAKA
jgi:hypothetical protein